MTRLNEAQLLRIFNSARHEPEIAAALRRVQDAVLAANGLLPKADAAALRATIIDGEQE